MAGESQYHKPTKKSRQTVEILYSAGVSEPNIAARLDITPKTLRKHYRKELDTGKHFLGELALKRLAKDMMSPRSRMAGTVAAIFIAKNNLGMADKIERTGEGDTNVTIASGSKIVILPSNGREQIAQERLLARPVPMIEAQAVEIEK